MDFSGHRFSKEYRGTRAILRLTLLSLAALGVMLGCGAGLAFADGSCDYQDASYLNGSDVCQAGTRYRCDNEVWQRMDAPCALQSALAQDSCRYEGQFYASGRVNCQSGTQQRCDNGRWQSLGTPCDGAALVVYPEGGFVSLPVSVRTCRYRDAQFQAQSVMCKDGVTFICEGGAWTSLRTPCD
jgi:hypothetical protein